LIFYYDKLSKDKKQAEEARATAESRSAFLEHDRANDHASIHTQYSAEIASSNTESRRCQNEIRLLRKQGREGCTTIKNLVSALDDATSTVDSLKSENSSLTAAKSTIESQLRNQVEENAMVMKEKKSIEEAAEMQVRFLQNTIECAEAKVEEVKKEKGDMEDSNTALRKQFARLTGELARMNVDPSGGDKEVTASNTTATTDIKAVGLSSGTKRPRDNGHEHDDLYADDNLDPLLPGTTIEPQAKRSNLEDKPGVHFYLRILIFDEAKNEFVCKHGGLFSALKKNTLTKLLHYCRRDILATADPTTEIVELEVHSHKGEFLAANSNQYSIWVNDLAGYERELTCRFIYFRSCKAEEAQAVLAELN
jgi:hypothetical protein